jgi:hypothetical protein
MLLKGMKKIELAMIILLKEFLIELLIKKVIIDIKKIQNYLLILNNY